MNDVEALVRVLPVVSVSARAYTEGEMEMTMSDAITLEFKIKYDLLNEKEFPGYAHSEKFPFLKKQGWHILLTDMAKDKTIFCYHMIFRNKKNTEGRLIPAEEVEKEALNEEVFEVRQRFGQQGNFRFVCTFMHDSYVGFDKEVLLQFDVVKDDTTREIADYNDEDISAVKGPGLVQSMLDIKDESDSDSEKEDEIDTLKAKLEKAGLEKAIEKRAEGSKGQATQLS